MGTPGAPRCRNRGAIGASTGRAVPACLLAGLLAAAVAGACSEGEGERPPEERAQSAGRTALEDVPDSVPRIEDPPPAWRTAARLELVREVRGGALGEGAAVAPEGPAFVDIRDVTGAGGRRILVLDGADARVTVLDSAGHAVRRLGGRGPGPGELRTPDRVEPSVDGGVVVLERRPAAAHRWQDGEYAGRTELTRVVRSEPADDSIGTAGEASSGHGGGKGTFTPDVTALADWGPRIPGGRAVRLIRLDVSDPSASRSAVYAADSAGRIGSPVAIWSTPGTRSRLPEVFGARRSWTAGAGPDGTARIVVARGGRYEIRGHDTSGALRSVLRRDVEPEPVSEVLRERALDRFAEEARRAGAPPGMARRLRDRIPVAESLPLISGLWHSPTDGRMWVGIPGPGASGEPPSVIRAFDVYASDGSYLGRVPSPTGFELHRVKGRLLYGSFRDSLDVPGVRVYRLVEPGERGGLGSAPARR